MKKVRTGEHLIQAGVIDNDQLRLSLTQGVLLQESGERALIGEVMLKNNFVTPGQLDEAISASIGSGESTGGLQPIPSAVCHWLRVVPKGVFGKKLVVQSATMLDHQEEKFLLDVASQEVRRDVSEIEIQPVSSHDIDLGLSKMAGQKQEAFSVAMAALKADPENGILMQQMVESLFAEAVALRASDIHVRRQSSLVDSWVAYRIDGELQQKHLLPRAMAAALTTRIKTDASMDASEMRLAQDGRIEISAEGRKLDVRVSARPSEGGERIVMRILDPTSLKTISDLFPEQPELTARMRTISRTAGKSGGLMVVSGATGQGKSTTLYAALREMPRHKMTILTVENPVEYRMAFVEQVAFNPSIESSMGNVLRSFLRQDPDAIIVGETRDADTASTTLQAAESGHFVATTVHARDAMQTFIRFVDMMPEDRRKDGMLVLSSHLRLIVNQRLAKRLCVCAVPATEADEDDISRFREVIHFSGPVYKPVGCKICDMSGFKGRLAIADAIYIPEQESIRLEMARILRETDNVRKALEQKGVEFYGREAACKSVLAKGLIDIRTAASVMGVGI